MARRSVSREVRTDDQATGQLLYNLLGARVKQAPIPEEQEKPKAVKVVDESQKDSREGRETEMASRAELEREKEAFVDSICDSSTRFDVSHWIGRLYIMFGEDMREAAEEKESEKRMRGLSGMSAFNSDVGSSSQGSYQALCALSLRAHPEVGDENDQATWTDDERLRHYLEGRDPEQQAFVNRMIANHVRNLQMEVDAELNKGRRANMHAKGIYTDEKNDLRLKNSRRFMLKKALEVNMGHWLWEALGAWKAGAKQRNLERAQNDEPTDVDIVFKTLTKPSTNIDPTRMVTQIPQFKTLYTSYSLPANWRDRYLK
jgi:hypothetical protein